MKYAVAVDIGGTNTRVALIDEDYNIKDKTVFRTSVNDPYITLKALSDKILSYEEELCGAALSCPGPLDLLGGKVLTPPNLKGAWHNLDIAKVLSEMINIPVFLQNDANLAALAEANLGSGRGHRVVQYLTVSTGIGAGFVVDGKLFLGAHGFANEVANTIMIENGPTHGLILPGGIEAISSGTAIELRARRLGIKCDNAGDVYTLAMQGDKNAREVISDAENYLANLIAGIIGYSDPDIVILGGSVALKIPTFVSDVEYLVKKKVYSVVKPYVKLRKAVLGDDSGLMGAAYLVFNKQENLWQ